ncbi:aspartic protease, partial [Rhizoctonia solani AG-3 Rhs1AP]
MQYLITLLALVTASPAYAANPNAKGVSIPLRMITLPVEAGTLPAEARIAKPKAHKHQANLDTMKHLSKFQKAGVSRTSVKAFKRHNVPLHTSDRTLWAMDIQIGTPGQSFIVVPFSGSPNSWVYSTKSKMEENHFGKAFVVKESKTAVLLDKPEDYRTQYADGSQAEGQLYADTITIAKLTAEHQQFTVGKRMGPDFFSGDMTIDYRIGRHFPVDGVLGLQPSPSNIINTLFSAGKITSPIFAMYLSPGKDSELFIGGINPTKHTGHITYTQLLEQDDQWMVLGIISASADASAGSEITYILPMIIESGITFMEGPKAFVSELWKALGGEEYSLSPFGNQGYYTFPCNKFARITFTFNDRKFLFTEKDLIVRKLPNRDNVCLGAIRAHNQNHNFWLLGSHFMKSVYTIFDMGHNPRVGFATPVHLKETHKRPGASGSSTGS